LRQNRPKQAAARLRVAEDRGRRVREALAVTEELHARQQEQARKEAERATEKAQRDVEQNQKDTVAKPQSKAPGVKEPRSSTTDVQSRVMIKMADGGLRPADNV
jgi:hypothetical protein